MPTFMPRPLVVGNWKMNGTSESFHDVRLLITMLTGVTLECDVVLCPPATLLSRMHPLLKGTAIAMGGQDCHRDVSGAHTGDISAQMLHDACATTVIVGHSERRTDHGETSAFVSAKAQAAHQAGLSAIICIGETLAQREAGETLVLLSKQLKDSVPSHATSTDTIIAYEPVWAIGTGKTPTPDEVAQAHAHIRAELTRMFGHEGEKMRILYGGSVKPTNAVDILGIANVDGALVGGASLTAADFIGILKAYL